MPQQQHAWRDYPRGPESTVVGDLLLLEKVRSPELGNERDLLVLLPPSYGRGDARYPVLYMHDGQNLFDEATSYAGEWRVDESMAALAGEGVEAIVVAVRNAEGARADEYSPFRHPEWGGGKAEHYVRFLADTVKPIVDASFRTGGPEVTGIAGSSLGGLVSLYALCERPDVFSFAGVMSPAFWFTSGAIFPYLEEKVPTGKRIWMDVGDAETPEMPEVRRAYVEDARRAQELLVRKGYPASDLHFEVAAGAPHHESAWAERFPGMMRFWLAGRRARQ
jgi:predicted alpha/beta superfamily hydrolase